MKLSEKILYCRKKAGWSQEALADKLGVSRQAVSKWETGEAEPELSKLKLLAAVFQVSTDWLLSQDAPPVEPEQETSASQSAQPVSGDWMDKLPGFLSRMVRRFGWLYGIYLALGGAGIGFIGFLARTMSRKMFQSFNSLISDSQFSFSYPGMDGTMQFFDTNGNLISSGSGINWNGGSSGSFFNPVEMMGNVMLVVGILIMVAGILLAVYLYKKSKEETEKGQQC